MSGNIHFAFFNFEYFIEVFCTFNPLFINFISLNVSLHKKLEEVARRLYIMCSGLIIMCARQNISSCNSLQI